MSIESRKGIFRLAKPETNGFAKWYDESQAVLEQVVVVRCEFMAIYDAFEYHAFCPWFEEVAEGEQVPTYNAILEYNENGHPEWVRFERVDK